MAGFDWSNALSGGATGVGVGSAGGPWTAGAGGVLGFLSGGLGFGKAKKSKIKQTPNFSPEQEQLINEALQAARQGNQQAMKWLNSILSDEEGAFEDFERPFKEQFNEETVPGILERLNVGGNKGSSAVTRQLAQAGRQLSSDLATQRANLKGNAINQLNKFSEIGLRQKTTPYKQPGKPSVWEDLAPEAGASGMDFLRQYGPGAADYVKSLFNRGA